MKLTRRSIWNEAQNKPTQIVRDILKRLEHFDEQFAVGREHRRTNWLYEILLRRGVFKWLGVRRSLIKLKNVWKTEETLLLGKVTDYANCSHAWDGKERDKEYLKGYLAATQYHRAQVRALCHSDRWQVPDHDQKAKQWLEAYELPDGVKIVPNNVRGSDSWYWEGPFTMKHGPFDTPEEAVKDCLECAGINKKKKNEPVRRATPTLRDSTEGYDANGSPVSSV